VEVLVGPLVILPTTNHKLIFLNRHVKFVAAKTRNRKGDAQPFWLPIFTSHPLNIVRRVTIGGLGNAIEGAFDFIEAKQKWAR
jgi:hypothetical protein